MFLQSKILFFISFAVLCRANYGEFETKEDKPYKEIKFKIPQILWQQALITPQTQFLKSAVTFVVPIRVNKIQNNVIDEKTQTDDSNVNIDVNNTLVSNDIVQDPAATLATVTQASEVLASATEEPPQEVSGVVIRFPCTCIEGQCGCCTGSILERFSLKACGNITFVPEDFVFDVKLSVNNSTLIRQRVSASDPPPICFNPRRAPFVRVCVEISNIRIRNRNAYACLDINADIGGFSVYTASFRCFSLGPAGLQANLNPKPISSGPTPVSLFPNNNNDDRDNNPILEAAQSIFQGQGVFGEGGGPLGGLGNVVGNLFGGRAADLD